MTKISPNNTLPPTMKEKSTKATPEGAAVPFKVGEVVRSAVRCLLACLCCPFKLATKRIDGSQGPKKELHDEDSVQTDATDKTGSLAAGRIFHTLSSGSRLTKKELATCVDAQTFEEMMQGLQDNGLVVVDPSTKTIRLSDSAVL